MLRANKTMHMTKPACRSFSILARLRLQYAARFLLSFFRVKLDCARQIGGQLTPTLGKMLTARLGLGD